mgnify:CR=1 FL=1
MAIQTLNKVEIDMVAGGLLTDLLALFAASYLATNYYNYYNAAQQRAIEFGFAQGGDLPTLTASGN